MTTNLKLLAVFAHPDDESMGMGGTLTKYSAQGVETYLICASRGERGWFGPEEQNPGLSALGKTRTGELENAAKKLGGSLGVAVIQRYIWPRGVKRH
ncbi:MAG: PIG-L family deacetylase [Anaerolineae bacterium]|nr:PIG-L family deacetylase [Anaerolineae bacterium]